MTRPCLLLAALLLCPLLGCTKHTATEPVRTRSARNAIVGGSPDTNPKHNAVVFLEILDQYGQAYSFCTGTLITPTVVLTAGHCVSDDYGRLVSTPSRYGVFFDTDVDGTPDYPGYPCNLSSQCVQAKNVTQVVRHSGYDPEWGDPQLPVPLNDIAYVKISASAVPAGVTPIPHLTSALASGNLKAGVMLEFAGYGLQEHPGYECNGYDCPSGSLYHVSDSLDSICSSPSGCSASEGITPPGALVYTGSKGPCSGDSGGPAFLTISGQQYVAGVTSYGDGSCMTDGVSTDVSQFDTFLAGAVGNLSANGAACSTGATCQSGVCVSGVCCDKACSGTCQACTAALGASKDGTCTVTVNKTCNDGKACTENDKCLANGSCAGTAKVCPGTAGPCTNAGACNPSDGTCTGGGNKANGTACSDGNACTLSDSCQNGQCVGGSAINTCPAPSACKADSACNSATGACAPFANLQDGTACDDGNLCTVGDACHSGSCTAGTPKACPPPDACHGAGTCNPATGACSYSVLNNGTACDDHNACTVNDRCVSGVCQGTASSASCGADACHAAGTCDPATGLCSGTAMADGTACDDGDANTVMDQCQSGLCKGTPRSADPCFMKANGSACNDGNACSLDDICIDEVCRGTNPKLCPPAAVCRTGLGCNPQTGECGYALKANGSACDDGDPLTEADHCQAGKCAGEAISSGEADAGTTPQPQPQPQGCGCGTAGSASQIPSLLLGLAGLALMRRQRR